MSTPASAGEHASRAPRERRHAVGVDPVERRQVAVVDHGPHRHADPGAVEQDPQPDRHEDGRPEHDELVVADGTPRIRPRSSPSKNSGSLACTVSGGQITVASWMSATSRPIDTTIRGDRRRVVQAPHDAPGRCRNPSTGAKTNSTSTSASQHGQAPRVGRAELPVDERREHGDGAVGEVEDARRGVGDDQPAGRHRVDARRWPDRRMRMSDEIAHGVHAPDRQPAFSLAPPPNVVRAGRSRSSGSQSKVLTFLG